MPTDCSQQLTFWDLGTQQVCVDFQGGRVVSDAGLLPLRLLDKELRVVSAIAARLPDPRAQPFVTHTREAILTQEIYQILAGYPDGNDAQALRHDPLFQTLVDVTPDGEHECRPTHLSTIDGPLARGWGMRASKNAFPFSALKFEQLSLYLLVTTCQDHKGHLCLYMTLSFSSQTCLALLGSMLTWRPPSAIAFWKMAFFSFIDSASLIVVKSSAGLLSFSAY